MSHKLFQPTPYPDVNAILGELLAEVRAILGAELVGIYLDGSLTGDAFDGDSDIDFVVVSEHDISAEQFGVLQVMHDRLATLDTPWATELEGSYFGRQALRRHDAARAWHPNIERGPGERLKMVQHAAWWDVHRWIVRERGITLLGPDPQALIDPVSASDLQRAMLSTLDEWAGGILAAPAQLSTRGYQSYVVLSLCRILWTLEHGTIASKPAAARWAQAALDAQWAPLIERAWQGRHVPNTRPTAEDVDATLRLVRYVLQQAGRPRG